MKGHWFMYLILGFGAVAFLSRPAAAAGEMTAASAGIGGIGSVLTGQYAGGGGSKGSFNITAPWGAQSFNLG